MLVGKGVTRSAHRYGRWVIKLPFGYGWSHHRGVGNLCRAWLANRSEWQQRQRPDVCPPVLTIAHFVLIMAAGEPVAIRDHSHERQWVTLRRWEGYSWEETKTSSWARFGDRVLLVDYDRCWQRPRGTVGDLYFGLMERRARRDARRHGYEMFEFGVSDA